MAADSVETNMAKKQRKRAAAKASRTGWWRSLDPQRKRAFFRLSIGGTASLAAIVAMCLLTHKLEAHVDAMILAKQPLPSLVFTDMPPEVAALAEESLRARVQDLLATPWTVDHVCPRLAELLGESGWVAEVYRVRRTHDAVLSVSCRYRVPFAQVQLEGEFLLVDRRGTRLPGSYRHDPGRWLVQGVATAAPPAGDRWDDAGLRAGLDVLAAVRGQDFGHQLTAVIVDNVGGAVDPRASHIELATERAGGRIRWGSAPGTEIEENTVSQKIRLLEANYRRTGRVDGGYPVIDISTFPERFTVPG